MTQRRSGAGVSNAAFADHFDSTPMPFERWWEFMTGPTSDPEQWTVAELDGEVVGFALGSNRFASVGIGYVASLAVLSGHRGRGLAGALLRARFDDDVRRGRDATLLHCDSENTTGATRVYEAAGMRGDQELVAYPPAAARSAALTPAARQARAVPRPHRQGTARPAVRASA